jgi:hypothetical protein
MQFFILLIGVLVFSFYQFHQPPAYFNRQLLEEVRKSPSGAELENLEAVYAVRHREKKSCVEALTSAIHRDDSRATALLREELAALNHGCDSIRKKIVSTIQRERPDADANDTNYVFLTFVLDYLPHGLIGILIAIILLAAMGSTASGLNSLGSTTVVDIFRASEKKNGDDGAGWVRKSRISTAAWGVFSIVVALYAGRLGNLIEAVNILGSLFYGTILGIFLTALFLKGVRGSSVFPAAVITECLVILAWSTDFSAFLWLNLLGAVSVMIFSLLADVLLPKKIKISPEQN